MAEVAFNFALSTPLAPSPGFGVGGQSDSAPHHDFRAMISRSQNTDRANNHPTPNSRKSSTELPNEHLAAPRKSSKSSPEHEIDIELQSADNAGEPRPDAVTDASPPDKTRDLETPSSAELEKPTDLGADAVYATNQTQHTVAAGQNNPSADVALAQPSGIPPGAAEIELISTSQGGGAQPCATAPNDGVSIPTNVDTVALAPTVTALAPDNSIALKSVEQASQATQPVAGAAPASAVKAGAEVKVSRQEQSGMRSGNVLAPNIEAAHQLPQAQSDTGATPSPDNASKTSPATDASLSIELPKAQSASPQQEQTTPALAIQFSPANAKSAEPGSARGGAAVPNSSTLNSDAPPTTQTIRVQIGSPKLVIPAESLAFEIKRQQSAGINKFSIRLEPPELGRIDVKLEMDSDGSTRAHLSADRGDTLDLMQRDSRGLERALQSLGLKTDRDGLSFSLRQDTAMENGGGHQSNSSGGTGYSTAGFAFEEEIVAAMPETIHVDPTRINIVI